MSVFEALLDALFVMAVVFGVLAVLYLLIIVNSAIFRKGKKSAPSAVTETAGGAAASPIGAPAADLSAGKLKLQDVDEKTAAMIMAIVSDESGIPLSELCFKSIRLLNK